MTATIKIKLKVPKKNTSAQKPQFDSDKLSDMDIRNEFITELSNRFEVLQSLEEIDEECMWEKPRKIIMTLLN